MGKREAGVAAGVAVMVLIAWLVSFGGHLRVAAQLSAAAGEGDSAPAGPGPLVTGTCPGKWQPHVPSRAYLGPHRMYHHPRSASPNLSAPQQVAYDWLWSPPSEGDL
ncbi:MAG: hypothetical protein ACRDND_16295 [Streptosporangiaceae bacterium]